MSHRPLILLHGAAASAAQWASFIPVLYAGRPVVPLEFPGHGRTPAGTTLFSIDGFTHYLMAFLDQQETEQADVIGYSMGGYVALYAATQHPSRFGRIMTLATKFLWTPEIAEKECAMLNPDAIRTKVPQFARDLEERHAPPNDWREVLKNTCGLLKSLGGNNLLNHMALSSLPHPVLMMIGDRDKMVSLEETVDAYRSVPEGQLAVLPGTPHPLERLDAGLLRSIVSGFLV